MSVPSCAEQIHKELGQSRTNKDEEDVIKVKNTINNTFQNPIDVNKTPSNLVNIATGQIASDMFIVTLQNLWTRL